MSSTTSPPHPIAPDNSRILSMDQFRGYAIFGMLVVDYFGLYKGGLLEPGDSSGVFYVLAHLWQQLHHAHGAGFTFADLIAPVFMFVVGMGMRLSMIRRSAKVGVEQARWDLLKRYGIIVTLGFTIYTGYLWDALLNIGLAGVLALWVADKKIWQRVLFGAFLVFLYQSVFVWTSYGELVMREIRYDGDTMPLIWKIIPFGPELVKVPINGGPLGHWSWAFILLGGTIAYDMLQSRDRQKIILGSLATGLVLIIVGLALQSEWPGIKEAWPVAKNWATVSYAFVATGLCFLNFLLFYLICDVWEIELPNLSVLGVNPLAIYILQWCICETAHRFVPEESPWIWIILGWFLFYGVCYGIARYLYEEDILIKV